MQVAAAVAPATVSALLETGGRRPARGSRTLCVACSSLLPNHISDAYTQHVEQLLRTLNLNSPEPYVPKPPLSLSFDASPTSPEFSPASASSVLLTPTDLSPARSNFDLKLQAPYELLALSSSQLNQNSLLIDPASPTRNLTLDHHFSPSQAQAALYRHQQQQQSQYAISANSTYPYFFEPLSEQSSPVTPQHAPMFHSSPATPVTPHALYNSPPIRRVDTSRISVADWNVPLQLQPLLLQQQQQAGTAADWLRRDAKSVHDYGSSLLPAADDGMLRQSFSYHQSPQQLQSPSQSSTQQNQSSHVSSSPHEVSLPLDLRRGVCMLICAFSRSTSCLSCIRLRRRRTTSSSRASSSRPTSKRQSSCSKRSRLQMPRSAARSSTRFARAASR